MCNGRRSPHKRHIKSVVEVHLIYCEHKMLERSPQRLTILILVFTAIVAVEFNGCRQLPGDDYSSIMDCCKDSSMAYFEEVVAKCRSLNSSYESSSNDVNLTTVCERFCHLNHHEVFNKTGSISEENLVEFLKTDLPEQLHGSLDEFVAKCLPEVEHLNDFRIYRPSCRGYFHALVDCLQGKFFINCPQSEKVQSEMCDGSRLFVYYCGMRGLRDADRSNGTDHSEESISYYDSDESSGYYGLSSEYDSSYDSESYEFENVTEVQTEAETEALQETATLNAIV